MAIEIVPIEDAGGMLKKIRRSKGYSQADAGRRMGVTHITIGNHEKNTTMSLQTLLDYADAYGIKLYLVVAMDDIDQQRMMDLKSK